MSALLGVILAVLGFIGLWACGVGASIFLIVTILALCGLPVSASVVFFLFLKFLLGYAVSGVFTLVGVTLTDVR